MLFGYLISKSSVIKMANFDRLSELQFLAIGASEEEVDVVVFAPSGVNWADHSVSGLVFNVRKKTWKSGYTPFPDFVYDRAAFGDKKQEKLLAKAVRKRLKKEFHVPFLNAVNSFDKWKTYQVLSPYAEINKFLPDTRLYRDTADLAYFLAKYGVVYLKPCGGSWGQNVFRVKRAQNGKYLFSHRGKGINFHELLTLEEFHKQYIKGNLAGKKVIVQQGISLAFFNGTPFDMRIRAQKNGMGKWEIVAEVIRLAAPGSVVTNTSNGGKDEKFNTVIPLVFPGDIASLKREIVSLVSKTCDRLEENFGRLGEIGFDIALDQANKLWLLEMNAKPGNGPIRLNNGHYVPNRFINPVKYAKYLWISQNDFIDSRTVS